MFDEQAAACLDSSNSCKIVFTHSMYLRAGKSAPRIAAAWSRAWRCLLMVCVWQGPIPWWHCHDAAPESGVATSEWLVRHLHEFHPGVAGCANCALGWHMHLSFPESSEDSDESPTSSHEQFLLVSANAGDTACSPRASGPDRWSADDILHRDVATNLRRPSGVPATAIHFFDGFATDLPLPLRFGVARC